MSATIPTTKSLFEPSWAAGAAPRTITTALGTPAGKFFAVGPEHFLISMGAGDINGYATWDATSNMYNIRAEDAQFFQMAAMDVSELSNPAARILVRPAILSENAEDLITKGKLATAKCPDEGAIMVAVNTAAMTMGRYKLQDADVIVLEDPRTGTVVDHMMLADLLPSDKTGRTTRSLSSSALR